MTKNIGIYLVMWKECFLIITGIGIENAKKAVVKLKQLNNNKMIFGSI